MYIKSNGAYKKIISSYQKINGVYKRILNVYTKEDGSYKKAIGYGEALPNYSLNSIDVLVEANKYVSIPVVVNDVENDTMIVWNQRIDSGNFSFIQTDFNKIELLTDNQSSTGAIWALVDGESLGEIPVNIKYSGGL